MMKRQQGVISIEFSIGFLVLMAIFIAIIEVSRYTLIVNTLGGVLTESVRMTRVFESERFNEAYQIRLREQLYEQGLLWRFAINPNQFDMSVQQYPSLQALVVGDSELEECNQCPIVAYNMTYHYSPMLSGGRFAETIISRQLIAVQEHEGW
jgi:tight adherence protein E